MTAVYTQNLTKSYGANQVLRGVDLHLAPGQIIGYIGPNGAGKSTTLRILAGLDTSFGGTVETLGIDVRQDPMAVKRRIGYLPESADMYDVLTPNEYYELIGGLHDMERNQILKRTQRLEAFLQLSYHPKQRIETFSKGMRQKVLLTSTLLHNPDLIFMDEPLNGLDANSVIRVKELLNHLATDGKTIFYSSHIMDVVERISGRIVLLHEGRIVANGSFAEINEQRRSGNLENLFAEMTGGTLTTEVPDFKLGDDE